jgi:hypothetical protein
MSAGVGRFTNLLQVLPATSQKSGHVRILTLELYDDGLVVRWVLPRGVEWPHTAVEAGSHLAGLTSLKLHDDVGTPYERMAMSAGNVAGVATHGYTVYRPAVPKEARRLDLLSVAGLVRFAFQAARETRPIRVACDNDGGYYEYLPGTSSCRPSLL